MPLGLPTRARLLEPQGDCHFSLVFEFQSAPGLAAASYQFDRVVHTAIGFTNRDQRLVLFGRSSHAKLVDNDQAHADGEYDSRPRRLSMLRRRLDAMVMQAHEISPFIRAGFLQ